MPARVFQVLRGGQRIGLAPTAGVLGPIMRGKINGYITRGIGAARATYLLRQAGHVFESGQVFDQYARQFTERTIATSVRQLGLNQVPSQENILESEFKVPQRYRYRVKLHTTSDGINIDGEKFISIYSDQLKTKQEAEALALQQWEPITIESDKSFAEGGGSVLGAGLDLIEHNFGASY